MMKPGLALFLTAASADCSGCWADETDDDSKMFGWILDLDSSCLELNASTRMQDKVLGVVLERVLSRFVAPAPVQLDIVLVPVVNMVLHGASPVPFSFAAVAA